MLRRSLFGLAALMLTAAACGDSASHDAAPLPDAAAMPDAVNLPDLAMAMDATIIDQSVAMNDAVPPADFLPSTESSGFIDLIPLIPPPDVAVPPDLTLLADLMTPPDLTPPADLVPPPDLTPIPDLTQPDLGPSCSDGKKNGGETDVDCGGACPPCAVGKSCTVATDCFTGYCGAMHCINAPSCAALKAAGQAVNDGPYTLDFDGAGPLPATIAYCDFTGGGWTLVLNQMPTDLLPNSTADVGAGGFGSTNSSYRFGNATLTAIVPTTAWKLTDPSNAVYFKPTCKVDWTHCYLNQPASDCTTGYTTSAFTTAVNGGFINVSTAGIGINNSGSSCSIRSFECFPGATNPVPQGAAATCNYNTTARVSLWFK